MVERKGNLDLSEKHYDPSKVEERIYKLWEDADVFRADNKSDKPPYTIMIPLPNITGRLHMGHALNNSYQDLLTRYKRMDGFDALWMPGTDHAGIATQSVVKKHLDAEGIDYRQLGREKMVARIWEWKEKYGNQILNQLRRLGSSCDWSRTRFTMDEGLSYAVRTAFKRFYDAGLIYRGKYIVNWCPVDRTALSDDEVETAAGGEAGSLWYFKYPLADESGFVTVATTRPETMLGDTAVAVNPKDERFSHLIGKKIKLPLVGREIPVIADDYVDPKFGTGCVKITPAHDPNDFQMSIRHNLPQINVMNEDATMNDEVPKEYRGLDRFECRKKVVEAFKAEGLFEKQEDHTVPVGRSYRSKAIIEYRLSDQWFVKMQPLAQKALAASNAGEVKFFPERWDKFYRGWLENCRDWCISRQLWWGHRIPAWYHKESGEIVVDIDTPEQVKADPDSWYQDEDVLDTWFSSALWPYSTLGWPDQNATDLNRYYPTSVLVTGKDIIFFWVARMVMTGLFHMEKVPFSHVAINSIVCDEDGETMSKSKGNGIDPLHVIEGASVEDLTGPVMEARPSNMEKLLKRVKERFPEGFKGVGADALRYTLYTSATDAQQIQISLKRFDEIGRALTDKIWNASKLVFSSMEEAPAADTSVADAAIEDKWLLSRLDRTVIEVRSGLDNYQIHRATEAMYRFFWDDLCDWYLEIVKERLKQGDDGEKRRVLMTMGEALGTFLRLMHPIMPFITEELWGHLQSLMAKHKLFAEHDLELSDHELCVKAPYPKEQGRADEKLDQTFGFVQQVVRAVRNMRASGGVSPKDKLECAVLPTDTAAEELIESSRALIVRLANLKSLEIAKSDPEKMAVTVLDKARVFVNLLEYMDISVELERNEKALAKLEKDIAGLRGKLSNDNFVSKAPEKVVQAERQRLEESESKLEQLRGVIAELKAM